MIGTVERESREALYGQFLSCSPSISPVPSPLRLPYTSSLVGQYRAPFLQQPYILQARAPGWFHLSEADFPLPARCAIGPHCPCIAFGAQFCPLQLSIAALPRAPLASAGRRGFLPCDPPPPIASYR